MGFRELVDLGAAGLVRTFSSGDTFLYSALDLAATPIEGVFTEPHQFFDVRTNTQVSQEAPTVGILRAALPREPRRDDRVVGQGRLAGRVWNVSDVQFDGEAIYVLVLRNGT